MAHIVPKNTLAIIVFNIGDDEHQQTTQGQQPLNVSSTEYSNSLDDNNLELSSSTASKKNLLSGFMINDDETNENHFDESSESTDSDFVMLSDSELNDVSPY